MPDRMTIAETQALDTLDPVPEYSTNKNVTQPFNVSPNHLSINRPIWQRANPIKTEQIGLRRLYL